MDSRFAVATIVGAVVLMVLGFVFYGLLLMDFFAANTGTATGVVKDPPDWLWLSLGQIAGAALLTLVIGWAGAKSPAAGLKVGAIFGFLMSLGIGLTMLGTTNTTTLVAAIVDPFVAAAMFGITGAVVAKLLARPAAP